MTTPSEIEAFARDPANHDAFAGVLERVLPDYTRFLWGSPVTYKRHFLRWQQAGFTLYPNHYYSPVPDLTQLDSTRVSRKANLAAIDLNVPAMLELASSFHQRFSGEYALFGQTPPNQEGRFFFGNGVFERADAEVLHCMVRHHGPQRVVEIGSGFSSLITAAACEINRAEGRPADFTLIEPFPNDLFARNIPGITRLLRQGVEFCPLTMFEDLEAGDILFIDSSHVIRAGNDVEHIYFEILPRLRPGVIIHIHDIFLPFRYPEEWITRELIFWNEQYLVEAMLMHNQAFEVLWAGFYLDTYHPELLEQSFPGYKSSTRGSCPGSFWLTRK